jgi:predicted small secreted protein
MIARIAFAALTAVVFTLAACSGSGGGGKDYSSAADLAKAAGCTGYQKQDPALYEQEEGACQINGTDIYVVTFADTAARDNWMKVAKAAGASGFMSEGDKWVLYGDDKASVEKGAKAAGGQLTS